MAQLSSETIKIMIDSQMKGLQLLEHYDASDDASFHQLPVPETTVFLDSDTIIALHAGMQTQGTLRDNGLLASALARAEQAAVYAEPTIQEMGLLIAEGIIRNHPFTDGNKRTADLALCTFLTLNKTSCPEDPTKTAEILLALTLRKINIEDAGNFLRMCPQVRLWEKLQPKPQRCSSPA